MTRSILLASLFASAAQPAQSVAQPTPTPRSTQLVALGSPNVMEVVRARSGLVYYTTTHGELRIHSAFSGASLRLDSGTIHDLAISPNGDRLAFTRGESDAAIWTLRLNPRTGRAVGFPRRSSVRSGRGATFSPDGRHIAFSALPATDSTVAPRIVRVPVAGGPEQVLASEAGWSQSLRWSPDGRWVYYRHGITTGGRRVRTLKRLSSNGGASQTLVEMGDLIGISPDGKLIAHTAPGPLHSTGNRTVVVADANGKELQRVELPGTLQPVAWGPGERQLLIRRAQPIHYLRFVDLNGQITTIARSDIRDASPRISPDGRHILMRAGRPSAQLAVVDRSSGRRRTLSTRTTPSTSLFWLDGSRVAYITGDNRRLQSLSLNDSREQTVAECSSQVRDLHQVGPGRFVYVCERNGVAELLRIVAGTNKSERVAAMTAPAGDYTSALHADERIILVSSPRGVDALPFSGPRRTLYTVPAESLLDGSPSVSRDGKWIAFLTVHEGREISDSSRTLHVVPIRGGTQRSLRIPRMIPLSNPMWDPAMRFIAIMGEQGPRPDLWLIPLSGDTPYPLTSAERFALDGLTIAPDGSGFTYVASGETVALDALDLPEAATANARSRE